MVDSDSAEQAPLRLTLTRDASGVLGTIRKIWDHRIGRWLAIALIGLVVLWFAIWLFVARDLPDARTLLHYEPPLPTNIRDINGTPIQTFARERRVQLSYNEYPKLVVEAFVSAEDKNFFTHGGIDYLGIVSAVFDNVTSSNKRSRGASTITQQVAKNLLLSNEYSYSRKLKEAILAKRIESALTKEQIMELYLNQIFLGRNAYGVQSAARAYFNKDVGELTLPEAAYLAVLPKAPSTYDPVRQTERALARRNYVLREMRNNGYITEAQFAAASASPLGTVDRAVARTESTGDYFTEEVRRALIDRYGEDEKAGPYSVYSGGLWVRTSLDPAIQADVRDALRAGLLSFPGGRGWTGPVAHIDVSKDWAARFAARNATVSYKDWRTAVVLNMAPDAATIGFLDGATAAMPSYAAQNVYRANGAAAFNVLKPGDIIVVGKDGNGVWGLRNIPEIGGGMVVQNPHTGQVLGMQGGFDSGLQSFNRASQALRQPGSSFKPFVYAAALDHGMTPASIIVDGPFCVYQGPRLGQKCFRNFGGAGGAGPQTMRWGLEQSRNLMTVRAASQTGMDNIVKLAAALGVSPPGQPYPKVLAVALGAGETTVKRMVNAYSILANNGRSLQPTMVDFVQDRRGKVIYRADDRVCKGCNMPDWDGKPMPRPAPVYRQILNPMTAYQTVHMMEGVIQRGTATLLKDLNRPIFGKTGTTTGPTNVWFVGGSADLVGGVYIGYDQPRAMGQWAQGGVIAAPIFNQFAKAAMKDMPVLPFRATGGVSMVRIDRHSGHRVFGAFPSMKEAEASTIWEAFKPENEPKRSVRDDNAGTKALAARTSQRSSAARRPASQAPAAKPKPATSDFLQEKGGIY